MSREWKKQPEQDLHLSEVFRKVARMVELYAAEMAHYNPHTPREEFSRHFRIGQMLTWIMPHPQTDEGPMTSLGPINQWPDDVMANMMWDLWSMPNQEWVKILDLRIADMEKDHRERVRK